MPGKFHIFQLLVLFFLWATATALLNFQDMSSYYFKGTSGITRFLRQYISFIISAFILLLTFYSILKTCDLKTIVFKIRRVILYSFIIVSIYGIIEFLVVTLKVDALSSTLFLFDYFPFTSVNIDKWTNRISSVTFETPALATYLTTIAGWMFSYILTEKGIKRFLPGVLVILFSFLSGSRAGFFIIIIQVFVFVLYLLRNRKFNRLFVNFFLTTVFFAAVIVVFYGRTASEYVYDEVASFNIDDSVHANSNKTRFGIQYAMFQVFLENPIVGTGYGLQAYEAKEKYPKWAIEDNWEFRIKHLNENHKPFPPGFNLYLRTLSETGIVGFAILIVFFISIMLWCYNKTFVQSNQNTIIALIITISMTGFLFNWLKMDTFRIYGFWLCLAIIFRMNYQKITNAKT